MMDFRLKDMTSTYSVNISEEDKGNGFRNVTITDTNQPLRLTVQYKDERIFAVYFLSSQFFELSDDDLYLCVKSILAGDYSVRKKSIFKSQLSIVLRNGVGNKILPDRVVGHKGLEEKLEIPISFTKR